MPPKKKERKGRKEKEKVVQKKVAETDQLLVKMYR